MLSLFNSFDSELVAKIIELNEESIYYILQLNVTYRAILPHTASGWVAFSRILTYAIFSFSLIYPVQALTPHYPSNTSFTMKPCAACGGHLDAQVRSQITFNLSFLKLLRALLPVLLNSS